MDRLVLRLTLLLFASGPGASSERLPIISHVPQQQVVDLSTSVQLSCVAPYSTGYPVLWVRQDGAVPLSTGCSRILPDGRFVVTCQPSDNTYTLTISDVQETDAGWYECLVLLDSATTLAANTQVVVRVPPYILDASTRSAMVMEGGSVTLRCLAKGFPKPRVTWRRKDSAPLQGGASLHRGGMLHLRNVSGSDAGTYECVADNSVGRAARFVASVQVSGRPRVWTPRARLGQALRHHADLLCLAEGHPPPVIVWTHRSARPLANSQRYSVSQVAGARDAVVSTLTVSDIQRSQLGLYTCTAFNKFGSSSVNITLFETVNPTCPPSCGALP